MASHEFEAYFYVKSDNFYIKLKLKAYLIG